jgi:Bacterial Ig-like domain (group 3)/Putative Ig domain
VSFTVTVSPSSSSSLTPSGNVTISDGSTTLGTVALTSGTAIFSTSALAVGSHSITASYSGDANFSASTSIQLSQVVNQGTTTTSVVASPNPAIVGQPVTLTATIAVVAPAAGTPGVTVTFLDGSTSLGTGTLSAGQAALTTSALAAGSHSITATYGGDSNFLGSSSSTLTLGIQQLTTTTLVAAPNPANAGQLVTLSATVAAASGAPTGETVTFLDGATVLGTGTISAGGTATFTTASLATGNHSLSASYPGDPSFAPSTSAALTLSVLPPPAVITDNETITVTDTASFPDVFDAEAVKVTDQVNVYAFFPIAITPAPPILSGVANQLYSGVTLSGTGGYQGLTLSESGAVPGMSFAIAGASTTFSGTPTQAGTFSFTITATDSIGNKFSQNYSLMVSASCPAISVSPSGSMGIVTAGTAFSQTFVASGGIGTTSWSTASALPLGMTFSAGTLSGIPTQSGTFALTITATDQNGCQGSSSVSFVVVPPPAVITDSETITVTDMPSFPDVSDSENITVIDQVSIQVLNMTTTAVSLNGSAVYGTPVSVTVSVGSTTASVTGNVTLSVDGGTPATMLLTTGSATSNLGNLSVGPHVLAANFSAQGNFLGSSAVTKFAVTQAVPTISWKNPAPIAYGTALSSAQLNAIASVPGTLGYTPAAGALLGAGTQTLSVIFAPSDVVDFTKAAASVPLVVNQATPTIIWANPPAITYGTALSGKQLNAAASVAGTLVYNPPAGSVLGAGTQTLSVSFAPSDTVDYTKAKASVTLQINQATPVISWANPAPIIYGTALTSTQLNATASFAGTALPGTFVYNPPLKTVLNPGTQNLSVTFTPTDTRDYQTVKQSVSITVDVNGNLSIQRGQTYTFTNGSISGTVTINGGTLILNGSTVGNNLMMTSGSLALGGNSTVSNNVQIQGGSFTIGPATIKGNLQITNIPAGSAPGIVCGAAVNGSLQFQNNAIPGQIGPASCAGNTIGGNLQITGNTAPLQIYKNAVGGNLQVQSNTGSAQIFQNTIQNLLQCSGNSSPFTGGKNTAAGKQGQCAKF